MSEQKQNGPGGDFQFTQARAGAAMPRPTMEQWLGQAPDYPEEKIHRTLEADVVVCGAGVAGVAAARAAAEAGAKVVLVEKCARPQARSGQFAVIGGELMKRWGMDHPELKRQIVNDLMRDSSYRADQRLLNYFVDHIGEDFDWYLEGAPEGIHYQDHADDPLPEGVRQFILLMQHPHNPKCIPEQERFPCYPQTVQIRPGHIIVLTGNLDKAVATGNCEVLFTTSVRKLLRPEGGRVEGVIAESDDGQILRITASKGVVLATGDYAGNEKMLAYYCPWVCGNDFVPAGMDARRQPINTGDGHRMGLWVGAKMEEEPHGAMNHNMGGAMGCAAFLMLDAKGRRFMNEDCTGQQLDNRLLRMKDRMAWQIFDSDWAAHIDDMPFGHSSPTRVVDMEKFAAGQVLQDMTPMDGYASQWWLDMMVKRGGTVKADTLEELCEKTGLPADTALAEIERYNQLAEKGVDEDFGKAGKRLSPVAKGPFYASRIGMARLLGTVSGLETDEEARVFDAQREPIPGLYAAGNVQGNRFGPEYSTTLPGTSHSMALTFGRCAGRNAARGI